MNKGEAVKSYIMRMYHLRYQLQRVGETVPNMELAFVTLILESLVTTIGKKNFLPSFDEIVGNITQEESRMIARGKIQKHEEGELAAYVTHDKKEEGNRRSIKEASFSKFKRKERHISIPY